MKKRRLPIVVAAVAGTGLLLCVVLVLTNRPTPSVLTPDEIKELEHMRPEIEKLQVFKPHFFKDREVRPYRLTDEGAEYLFLALEFCGGNAERLEQEFEVLYHFFTRHSRSEEELLILGDLDGDGEAEVLVDTSTLLGGTEFFVFNKVEAGARAHRELMHDLNMHISVEQAKDGGKEIVLRSFEDEDFVEVLEEGVGRKVSFRGVYRFTGEDIEEVSPVDAVYGPPKPLDSPEFEGLRVD